MPCELKQQQLEMWMLNLTCVVFQHTSWFSFLFRWISSFSKNTDLCSSPSHAMQCAEFKCVYDSWLTLTAIWFHYAGRRSGAFYGRSRYIPQGWAGRESARRQKTDVESKVNKAKKKITYEEITCLIPQEPQHNNGSQMRIKAHTAQGQVCRSSFAGTGLCWWTCGKSERTNWN